MSMDADIYPTDVSVAEVIKSKKEASLEPEAELPITRPPGSAFHWVFRHVGLNQEYVYFGELLVLSHCLAIIKDGEYIATFPAAQYRAYRRETSYEESST